MVKISFTGTRAGMTPEQMARFTQIVLSLKGSVDAFHYGDCIGADEQAAGIVRSRTAWRLIAHPATTSEQRAYFIADEYRTVKAPLVRNHDMVDEADITIATPRQVQQQWRGSGTWATMRYTAKVTKPLMIIWPDGSMWVERLSDIQRTFLDSIVGA